MGFDTTSANTGGENGACVLLQTKIGKTLLSFACRHHVLETTVANLMSKLKFEKTGPTILLFKRLQQHWSEIDTSKCISAGRDRWMMNRISKEEKADIITFIYEQLQLYHPRGDYKELLILVLLILGDDNVKEKPQPPGAMSTARFMCQIIYCCKIYLYRTQISLDKKEMKDVQIIVLFAIKIYLKQWFTSSVAAFAPANDLNYLKSLDNFKMLDPTMKNAVESVISIMIKMQWEYLYEPLVGLCLFDERLPNEMRNVVANKILNGEFS